MQFSECLVCGEQQGVSVTGEGEKEQRERSGCERTV